MPLDLSTVSFLVMHFIASSVENSLLSSATTLKLMVYSGFTYPASQELSFSFSITSQGENKTIFSEKRFLAKQTGVLVRFTCEILCRISCPCGKVASVLSSDKKLDH